MLTSVSSFYHTNQTRILLFAVCFAMITNIATIMILFEQLEHESVCDQQNEFNDFVETNHHSIPLQLQIQQTKSNEIIIPKPNKLKQPPTIESKPKTKISKSNTPIYENESAILTARGGKYEMHTFEPSLITATDWRYYLDINVPKISYSSSTAATACNHLNFASSIFMNALSKWIWMREYGWFIQYDCPSYLQTEYRPIDLIPHIYQTQCAPFWPSDIIYLLSHILTPSMLSIQYGFNFLSSIWIANFIDSIKIVDHRRDKIDEYEEYLKMNKFDLSNVEMEYEKMSRRYVEIIDPKKGRIVDFVIIDQVPEYHEDVLKYILSVIKENNAILIIKLSDDKIPQNINEIIDDLIPKYWLKYDSFIPEFLVQSVPFSQEQYLEGYNMTLWITRTENDPCDVLSDI